MQYYQQLMTPCGALSVHANPQGVTAVKFTDDSGQPEQVSAITETACQQLEAYFAGRLRHFTVPLAASGTPFQQQVWHALTSLPYGQTASYAMIAQQINNPKAVRAVGMANSKNPIAIIVPCHRVIGANGTLTGYAGGIANKAYLLRHEGVSIAQ